MKGFFSFIVVLILIILLFSILVFFENEDSKKNKLINTLIEIENASLKRSLIENNLDRIIEKKLLETLITENYTLSNAKENVNKSIINYLNDAKIKNIYFKNDKKISLGKLNSITNVSILEFNGIKFALFEFTSNSLKNQVISKKLSSNFEFYFELPINYQNKVVILSA